MAVTFLTIMTDAGGFETAVTLRICDGRMEERDFIKLMKELKSKSKRASQRRKNYWFSASSLALSECSAPREPLQWSGKINPG